MKKLVFLLSFVFSLCSYAQRLPYIDLNPWQVVFEDDFSFLNCNRWIVQNNVVHGDPRKNYEEPQIYTSDNVYTSNGSLILRTRKLDLPISCPGWDTCMYENRDHYYTSGEIISSNRYQYGYYEIRTKLPTGYGMWPAFWLQADQNTIEDPWYNEIDIFEGEDTTVNWMTCNYWYSFDYPIHDPLKDSVYCYPIENPNSFHWYGILWTPHSITWYYDREPVRKMVNNFEGHGIQHPMNIIVNTALFPEEHTSLNLTSHGRFPFYTYIDQLNVYQIDCQDSNAVVNEITDWSSYNYLVKKSISLSNSTQLPADEETSLYASDFIELKNGFTVPIGTSFYAGGCDYCK